MLPEQIIIRPVKCSCSNSHIHKTNHIECRCDGQERQNAAMAEHAKLFKAKKSTSDVLWPRSIDYYKYPINCRDEDDYPLCRYCGKIRFKSWLVQCPYCDKFFKGPVPWFNKKFHYECEECG